MAYKQNWLGLFAIFDVEKKGYVVPADAKHIAGNLAKFFGIPEDSDRIPAGASAFSEFFNDFIKTFDLNKDGKVTKEEFLYGIEQKFVGKSVDNQPDFWKVHVIDFFRVYDTNKNGELSYEEVYESVKRPDPSASSGDIKAAYEWALTKSTTGKFDAETFFHIVYIWGTSTENSPEAVLLLPLLRVIA